MQEAPHLRVDVIRKAKKVLKTLEHGKEKETRRNTNNTPANNDKTRLCQRCARLA